MVTLSLPVWEDQFQLDIKKMAEEEKLSLKEAIQFGINGYIPSVQLCIRNESAPTSYCACLDNMQIKQM